MQISVTAKSGCCSECVDSGKLQQYHNLLKEERSQRKRGDDDGTEKDDV